MADEGSAPRPELTVVIGSVESSRSIEACLASVVRACRGVASEILLVDASRDATAEITRRKFSNVRVLVEPRGTVVPELWARGIRNSKGRWVALTTGHCIVPPDWARAFLQAMDGEEVGGGGAGLEIGDETGLVDWATYYLRYAPFARKQGDVDPFPTRDVPGDNAVYRGALARAYLKGAQVGFWELDFHDRLRREDRSLLRIPRARAEFGPSFPLGTIVHHRFLHGRHFGSWRVEHRNEAPWRVALPSPLVPLVLLARAGRWVLPLEGHRLRFVTSAPVFLLLATAWAIGEAVGALTRSNEWGKGDEPESRLPARDEKMDIVP